MVVCKPHMLMTSPSYSYGWVKPTYVISGVPYYPEISLMIPLFSIDEVCHVCRKVCLDTFRERVIHCTNLSSFKWWHDLVRDVMFDIFWRVVVSVRRRRLWIFLLTHMMGRSTLRLANVLVYGWIRRKHVCVDLTWVSPLVWVKTSDFTVVQTALKVASSKVVKHEKTCFNNQHVFILFVFNTFDFLAPKIIDFL